MNIGSPRRLRALLVDPSLFTAPYDAALDGGLQQAGVCTQWAVRPVRQGDRSELAPEVTQPLFYKHVETLPGIPTGVRKVLKGAAHVVGLARTLRLARRLKVDVVHFQWTVVPPIDAIAMAVARPRHGIVLTVHDTVPHNGERTPWLQRAAFDLPIRLAHHVIVHTQEAKQRLIGRGIAASKVEVVPHGPLSLPPELDVQAREDIPANVHRFTLFGEIKHYKGLDVLVEAVALLSPADRQKLRVVVAGRPQMDMEPLVARISQLGLSDCFDLRLHRQSEQQMAQLFARTDCFLFPYRQIDASGVFFLTQGYARWMIASNVGVFKEHIQPGANGDLVPPESPEQLAERMRARLAAGARTRSEARFSAAWQTIGQRTKAAYERVSFSSGSTAADDCHSAISSGNRETTAI